LRNTGKRNQDLNKAAIETTKEIHRMYLKAAHWVATNAIKELERESIHRRLSKQQEESN